MDDMAIKKAAAEFLRHKTDILRLLDHLRPEDVERGLLIIPDRLINEELRPFIFSRAAPFLTNYLLTCTQTAAGISGPSGLIFLDLDLTLRQLGRVQARYMISISELRFASDCKRLVLSYREDLKMLGNPLQTMALKALLGDKTLLMKAAELSGLTPGSSRKQPILSANREAAVADLSRLPQLPEWADHLDLTYQNARDGALCFRFSFV